MKAGRCDHTSGKFSVEFSTLLGHEKQSGGVDRCGRALSFIISGMEATA